MPQPETLDPTPPESRPRRTWLRVGLVLLALAAVGMVVLAPLRPDLTGSPEDPAGAGGGSGPEVNWGLLRQLEVETGETTPALREILDREVHIPGYVVPLDWADVDEGLHEFLLVPWAGACVHVPPPPANQMIHVRMADDRPLEVNWWGWDPIWMVGRLEVADVESPWGRVGFRMTGRDARSYFE